MRRGMHMLGRHLSEETKKKISDGHKKRGLRPPLRKGFIPTAKQLEALKLGTLVNKGIKHTPEHKRKIAKKLKGIKRGIRTEEHRLKLSRACKGRISPNRGKKLWWTTKENHWNWQGGISLENRTAREAAMATLQYKLWRKAVFQRDGYRCIKCLTGKPIEADHIKPYAIYKELRYAIDNGQTLCKSCHQLKTTTDRTIYQFRALQQ